MSNKKTAKKKVPRKKTQEKDFSEAHLHFIAAYMTNGYNGTRAYKDVYPRSSYNAARSSAADLLANPNIRARIAEEFKKRVMGTEEVLARLSDMARASHYPFIEIDEDGFIYFDFSSPEAKDHLHLIKKIRTKRNRRIQGTGEDAETWEGEWIEVELHDSKDALKLIGEKEGLFKPEKGDEGKFTAPQIVEIIKTYEEKREK